MALTPKERADFDDIVLRLRLEDADLGVIHTRLRPFALLVSVVAATLVFGLGVVLLGHGVLAPVLMIVVLLVGLVLAGRVWYRAHTTKRR
jgi:F0F1-type ATP synthase assembly protein I